MAALRERPVVGGRPDRPRWTQPRGRNPPAGSAPGPGVLVLAVAGAFFGAAVLGLAAAGRDPTTTSTLFSGVVGGLYLLTGACTHLRRPGPIGGLMVAVGIGWFAEDLQVSVDPTTHTAGLFVRSVASALLVHLLVAFPTGRLRTRGERVLVAGTHLVVFVLVPLGVPTYRTLTPNLLLVADLHVLQDALLDLVQVAVSVAVVALLVRRWVGASGPARRVLAPVYGVGLVGGAASVAKPLLSPISAALVTDVAHLATLALPIAFLAGALRVRLGRTAVADLLVRLSDTPPVRLQDLMARALGDPTLRIAHPAPGGAGYVDDEGTPVAPRPADALTRVHRNGREIAVLLHDPALLADRHVLEAAVAAAALELDNQRLTAEVKAQLAEVRASRARIVAAADQQRHRVERDLHDGAQQQLVTVGVVLRLARNRLADLPPDPVLDAYLHRAATGLGDAVTGLRELARGIHPAVLTEAGLLPALRALAQRCTDPVEVVDGPDLPPLSTPLAATAYFVAAEAVTNAAKHARADHVRIHVRTAGSRLLVTVSDDGVGGADPAAGTGLLGLRDRVAALDGVLAVGGSPGEGTSVHADLPLEEGP